METLPQQAPGTEISPASANTTWLCASDVDGTLVTALGAIMPRRNKTAIAQFRKLGGRFTIASGRSINSVERLMKRLGLEDTPAIVLNGAGVYDCAANKILRYHPIPKAGIELAFELYRKFPRLQFAVHREHSTHLCRTRTLSFFGSSTVRQPRFFHRSLAQIPQDGWGKCIFFGKKPDILALKDYCYSLVEPPLSFMESSGVSFELLAPGVHKGTAMLELAEILGINPLHTAAIGNYDNDTGLLACAAVTAAPSSAPEDFRAKAQHIVCADSKGAVADFLAILEERIR
ncbi:MAG: HAD family hydrolase [Oscillospiraceae bacterium]|jgi:Cof subfamily protein (haloacid dehalogenase superfamily)|nr:HAD family hydrolase [Oscillospiraceae bacterium]